MAITVPIISTWEPKGVDKSIADIQKAEGAWGKTGAGIKAAAVPAAVALGGIATAGFKAAKAAEESAKVNNALAQVYKSMGYPENAAAAAKYADEISRATGIDDEAIIAAQTKLATFDELAKNTELMGRATQTAADMQAAGLASMDSASVMLGKALQDPIKGITALTRVGVTFTKEEQAQIKAMVAAGDTAGAQAKIMGALEKQVGGVAEATATNSEKMATSWGNLSEAVGEGLLPVMDDLTGIILTATDFFTKEFGRPPESPSELHREVAIWSRPTATTIAGGDGSRQPSKIELDGARFQGRHTAEVAAKLFG